jgi:hypothetical protein
MASTIIAFHGDYATPKMLKEDMGDLAHSVDYFFNGHDFDEAVDLCRKFDEVSLIGYSAGGGIIADLSVLTKLNIKSVVLYESPLGLFQRTCGKFPACIIWNKNGRMRDSRFNPYRERAINMVDQWKHPVSKLPFTRHTIELEGNGRHLAFKFRIPPFGHAWDRTLNKKIREFLFS